MKSKYLCRLAAFMIVCLACSPVLAQWTTYQGNASHDGYVPMSLNPMAFSLLWQRSFTTSALNPVTAGNGEVFLSIPGYYSSVMGLQVLDAATGETKWSKSYGSIHSVNPPAYANGKVYIQTCNHTPGTYLWAYDANTGNQIFSAPFGAQWESYYAPTIVDDTAYINGGYYGGMYAFNASTGQQQWFVDLNQYDEWTPAVDANYAYAYTGDYSPSFTAIDRISGKVAFQIEDPNFDWNGWSMNEAVALGTHNDAFGINANRLICFDLQNKNIKWELKRSFNYPGQATVAKGIVYAIDGGVLDAVDELTGNLLWSWSAPSGNLTGTIIATNTHLFASTSDTTYAVDLAQHTTAWSYPLGGKLALSNRALYIAGSTGTLAAISIPKSSIYSVDPSDLSISITNPAGSSAYIGNTNSISISGTANELDSSGNILGSGHLASVTWSSNKGGSGVGFYDSSWNTPTKWSVSNVVLQPGDNIITVTATDLWGNTAETSITLKAPTGFSIAITNPTSEPLFTTNTTPISLSGTASAVDSSGKVYNTTSIASITWKNDRGGSGTGTCSSGYASPTTWSISNIALQPGNNIITVTATDLWGHSATCSITIKAPTGVSIAITSPTNASTFTTNSTPIALSGTASAIYSSGTVIENTSLSSIKWTNDRGGSGTGTFSTSSTTATTWSIKSIALQGGNNVITVTATDLWGNTATDVITVTWTPGSIGAVKKLPAGTMVYVDHAVVTANNIATGSIFVESSNRSSGIKLVTDQPLNIGNELSLTGTINRVNGEYQISNITFLTSENVEPLRPLYLTLNNIANDKTESLNYVGLNTTGLLVKTAAKVTGTVTTQKLFYIDDGNEYQDGAGPVYGIRVHVPSGVTIPRTGKWVAVTGISRVEKITLNNWGELNGDWYPAGTVLYVPSIWIRSADDIQLL